MTKNKKHSGPVLLIEPIESSEEVLFHELIVAVRLMGEGLLIGAYEHRYSTYEEASKIMDVLIKNCVFHAGTIRTHYRNGTVRLNGSWLYGATQYKGIGEQVAADMLGHIVGDYAVGILESDRMLSREVVKDILTKINAE